MKYNNTVPGIFQARPNRFIAHVEIDGNLEVVHVKNTGRCRELLPVGAEVWCEISDNPKRKTKFDLITVKKGHRLINMDSQAPNKAAGEWLRAGGLGEIQNLKAQTPSFSRVTPFTSRKHFRPSFSKEKSNRESS